MEVQRNPMTGSWALDSRCEWILVSGQNFLIQHSFSAFKLNPQRFQFRRSGMGQGLCLFTNTWETLAHRGGPENTSWDTPSPPAPTLMPLWRESHCRCLEAAPECPGQGYVPCDLRSPFMPHEWCTACAKNGHLGAQWLRGELRVPGSGDPGRSRGL